MNYPTYMQPYGNYQYPNYIPPRLDQTIYNPTQMPQNATTGAQSSTGVSSSPNVQTGFLCRPVTSREEALAIQADFMSAGTIMPDLGHGMMYLKRFDSNTGLSNLFEFALVQPQQKEETNSALTHTIPDYSETFRAFGEQLGSVSERIDALTDKLEMWKSKNFGKKGGNEE